LTDFLVAIKQSEISKTFSWCLWKHRRPLGANSIGFLQQEEQSLLICLVQAVLSQLFSPEMAQRAIPFTREDRHVTTGQLTLSLLYSANEMLVTALKISDSRRCPRGGFLEVSRSKTKPREKPFYGDLLAGF
jgi:hypothetical protein